MTLVRGTPPGPLYQPKQFWLPPASGGGGSGSSDGDFLVPSFLVGSFLVAGFLTEASP